MNAFDYLFDICVHLTITNALAHVGGTDYNPPVQEKTRFKYCIGCVIDTLHCRTELERDRSNKLTAALPA